MREREREREGEGERGRGQTSSPAWLAGFLHAPHRTHNEMIGGIMHYGSLDLCCLLLPPDECIVWALEKAWDVRKRAVTDFQVLLFEHGLQGRDVLLIEVDVIRAEEVLPEFLAG